MNINEIDREQIVLDQMNVDQMSIDQLRSRFINQVADANDPDGFPDLELAFLTETKTSPDLYDGIIRLENPTKRTALKSFDEIIAKNQGDDSFGMVAGFLWKRKLKSGIFFQSDDAISNPTRKELSRHFDKVMKRIQKGKNKS